MVCKECGKQYHHCSSCDTWGEEWLSDGWCSKECYNKSNEYILMKNEIMRFYNSLTLFQKYDFKKLIDKYTNEEIRSADSEDV